MNLRFRTVLFGAALLAAACGGARSSRSHLSSRADADAAGHAPAHHRADPDAQPVDRSLPQP